MAQIVCSHVAEGASFAQPGKEIVHVPTHQFETEDFIWSCRGPQRCLERKPQRRDRADEVTAAGTAQIVKKTSHRQSYTSRFRTLSALSSMYCRRGTTASPISRVNIWSA